ncbi:hypothetical protein N7462_001490 [Penicillium macrosclerotiorum]|uniref:uncharacterized protein n=1 Tax=Penicillium macrosclerotiorum TaxID=303699 RepID=UPI00254777EF|nr:uncharacterized protein N7462_001490 [Penicillium macrosclerotiorum]KAJ5692067.1 hypothetical protein N7462_001490 [Penicillium macrosclerotiorum]
MGQSQSTGAKTPDAQEAPSEQKTDYYELLEITRSASDEEIKKAYRRKALELHPDRNFGNVEEATRLFAEIQSAYEVLADPQERAWYDSHREAFLGTGSSAGGDQSSSSIPVTTAQDVLKMFSRFNPRMEFSDSPTGFFGGLREQFDQLAREEQLACQLEDQVMVDYPSFGTGDDDFETVVRPFYAAWSGFSTKKTFSWKDAYRYSEAPDRRVRRLMEKENRRIREDGIREFNDAVRSLVAFIKKRDPRYKANAQNEAQRQETLRQSVAAQAARSRAKNQASMREHVIPEWARSGEPVMDEDDASSESEIESFECVACNKHFKSLKQFEAHERSKKHLKAFRQLCREMQAQNDELHLESTAHANSFPDQGLPTVDTSESDRSDDKTPGQGLPDQRCEAHNTKSPTSLSGDSTTTALPSPDGDDQSSPRSYLTRRSLDSVGDEDYASRETIETRLRSDFGSESGDDDNVTFLAERISSTGLGDESPALLSNKANNIGKAKQRRAKKAARVTDQPSGLACTGCHAIFASKTKLFSHLKENPDHAHLARTTTKTKSKRR